MCVTKGMQNECLLCMSFVQAALLDLNTSVLQIIARYVFHSRLMVRSCKLG